MKTAKKILSILLCCLMLTGLLSVGVFAAEGDQSNPINANDKWFGYGVDCYLLNPTFDEGDTDGLWYELTAEQDGILVLEHSYNDVDYDITVEKSGLPFTGSCVDGVISNSPIMTLPLTTGETVSVHIATKDAAAGTVYANMKIVAGTAADPVIVKSKGFTAYVATGQTVYFQDNTLNADYATMGVLVDGSVDQSVFYAVTKANSGAISQKAYTDSDGDNTIEATLGGSLGSAGAPPVKPMWAIENNSSDGIGIAYLLTVVDSAHECVYDDAADTDCNTCGAIREVTPACEHEYFYPCDPVCFKCYEITNPDAAHSVKHVEAVTPTCDAEGNVEYWACEYCGAAWADEACTQMTNLMNVKLGASCKYGAVYTAAKDATCDAEGNVEYWYCANCDVYYADADCTVITNAKNVILPVSHNVIHVEAKDPTCDAEGNIEYWYCDICGAAWLDELCHQNTNLMAVKLGASCKYGAVYTAAKDATCYEEGNLEYWYCANCDVYYADADCTVITNAKNVILPVAHNVIHVEAKDPTCTAEGNIEYWYCDICGAAWLDELCHLNTNLMAVKLGASCKYGAVYTAAKDATCYEEGNLEYWYCANCDVYYADADCTVITNAKNVILPVAHNVIHVEAKDPTCTAEGNIEYWYCDICGFAWLDELCHQNTNLRAVVLPMGDHSYDHSEDVDCNVCGAIRPVDYMISNFDGNSVSEDVNGLAFKYTMEINNIGIKAGTKNHADYTNATTAINSVSEPVKVLGMGAIVTNNYSPTLADYVDGVNVLDVPCVRLWEDPTADTATFSVRIINIPDEYKDTDICVRPYLIYEDQFGNVIRWYGLEDGTSYNAVLNG